MVSFALLSALSAACVCAPQVASLGQPKLLAWILDNTGATPTSTATGSWPAVLAMVVAVNVLAATNYALHAVVTPIERLVSEVAAEKKAN